MATAASLTLDVWRNDDVYEFPLRVRGPDLTGIAMRAQVRLAPDTPGAPLIDLALTTNGNAEGIRLAGVSTIDGVITNDVRIRLNKSTRQALPYAGEMGDAAVLAFAFQIAGRTRLFGAMRILASAIDSDAAPASRSTGYGACVTSAPSAGGSLTIADDNVVALTIDGVDLIGPVFSEAAALAQASAVAAGQSSGSAGASAATADDRATQANTALNAIMAALGGYPHGTTLSAPVTSRALLRTAVQDTSSAAFLTEPGRRGNFVFLSGNMSALVAADPQEGVSVAPSTDRTGASGAWLRTDVTDAIHAEWFGAKGDGVEQTNGTCTGTDNTTAIQAAVNMTGYLNGVELRFGFGIFVIAGAPSGPANAQISLPSFGNQSDQRVLRIRGAAPQSMTWATNRGTVLRSTWTAPGDNCVIGAKHPGRGGGAPQHSHAVWLALYMDDLCVRCPVNPQLTGVDLSYFAFYKLTNFRIDVPLLAEPVLPDYTARFINSEPTVTTSYGHKGALNDLPLRCLYDNFLVAGFHVGMRVGELSGGDNLTFLACDFPIEVPNIRHGASFGYVLLCNNRNSIRVTASEPAKLLIQYFDVEHNEDVSASGSGPSWVVPQGSDIIDPDFMLRGFANVHYHSNNLVQTLPFKINGIAIERDTRAYHPNYRLRFVETGYNNDWPAPSLYPGFFIQNPAIHVVRRGVDTNDSRATAWHALATKQGNNEGGLIGGYVFVNDVLPDSQDKRIAGVYAELSGAEDSGAVYLATSNDGLFEAKWGVNPSGDMRCLMASAKVLSSGANNDRSGVIVLASQSAFVKTYTRPYNTAPVVIVTPNVLAADAVVRTESYADRFVVTIKKSDDTLYPVSGSLFYTTMGNPD